MPNDTRVIDTLIVNGCECEPYLTCDYRLMVEAPQVIVTGALLTGRAVSAREIVITSYSIHYTKLYEGPVRPWI